MATHPFTRGVSRPPRRSRLTAWLTAALGLLLGTGLRAEIQFDVFMGFDDRVREAHWFPVAYEILNDGPTFMGTVVLGPDAAAASQERTFNVELPTGTRKRVVIPVYSSTGRYGRWETRLLDPTGKVMAERGGMQPKDVAAHVPILGAIPRSFGGLPTLPENRNRSPEFAPAVARLQLDYFPGNPLALHGLTACYLNSEKAGDLKPDQVDALLAWLHGGGHLVVALENPQDTAGLPWLSSLLPFTPVALTNRVLNGALQAWLRDEGNAEATVTSPVVPVTLPLPPQRRPSRGNRFVPQMSLPSPGVQGSPYAKVGPHPEFDNAPVPLIAGHGSAEAKVVAHDGLPLIVSAPRGQGTVTVLTFSPEREPFRSWKNRAWFWARLLEVSPSLLGETETSRWGGTSIDGLFGAMLDSRQVRKLPVATLLLLLLVYLVVIGPFDQWILKRTGKQMWTWVTFPLYVVIFSGLIYFIGYRLRAGELEWNELQVVDQLPRGEAAALRGRTWCSIYSPANARYRFTSEQPVAALRSELLMGGVAQGDSSRLQLRYPGKGFDAEAFVPVWVNQLYASDWFDAGQVLVSGHFETNAAGLHLVVQNKSALQWGPVTLLFGNQMFNVGTLAAGQNLDQQFDWESARGLETLFSDLATTISRVQQRRQAFGGEGSGQVERSLDGVILASLGEDPSHRSIDFTDSFAAPRDLNVRPLLARGQAVLFAWAPGQSIAPPFYRFTPKRQQRDSALRVALSASR